MIGGTHGGADGPEDVLDLISDIKSSAVRLRHLPLGKKGTEIVVRWDIEKFRLRAPCLRWPVLTTADARAEFAALFGARALRLIDDRSSRLGVNRFEHVVIRERKGVEKPELALTAIENPEISITPGMCRCLDYFAVDLSVDQQRCRNFIPVP